MCEAPCFINMSQIIHIPSVSPNGNAIEIDFSYWAQQEARIAEIATVTGVKAPELLATFNRACLELDRIANNVELEYHNSVRAADRLRAEILIDKVPGILISKGLATTKNPMGSEDLRNAVLARDPDYDQALERSEQLKALNKLMRGKFDAFERAFRSVRTLVGEQNFNYSNKLSGDTGTASPGKMGFGTPKY